MYGFTQGDEWRTESPGGNQESFQSIMAGFQFLDAFSSRLSVKQEGGDLNPEAGNRCHNAQRTYAKVFLRIFKEFMLFKSLEPITFSLS